MRLPAAAAGRGAHHRWTMRTATSTLVVIGTLVLVLVLTADGHRPTGSNGVRLSKHNVAKHVDADVDAVVLDSDEEKLRRRHLRSGMLGIRHSSNKR